MKRGGVVQSAHAAVNTGHTKPAPSLFQKMVTNFGDASSLNFEVSFKDVAGPKDTKASQGGGAASAAEAGDEPAGNKECEMHGTGRHPTSECVGMIRK